MHTIIRGFVQRHFDLRLFPLFNPFAPGDRGLLEVGGLFPIEQVVFIHHFDGSVNRHLLDFSAGIYWLGDKNHRGMILFIVFLSFLPILFIYCFILFVLRVQFLPLGVIPVDGRQHLAAVLAEFQILAFIAVIVVVNIPLHILFGLAGCNLVAGLFELVGVGFNLVVIVIHKRFRHILALIHVGHHFFHVVGSAHQGGGVGQVFFRNSLAHVYLAQGDAEAFPAGGDGRYGSGRPGVHVLAGSGRLDDTLHVDLSFDGQIAAHNAPGSLVHGQVGHGDIRACGQTADGERRGVNLGVGVRRALGEHNQISANGEIIADALFKCGHRFGCIPGQGHV